MPRLRHREPAADEPTGTAPQAAYPTPAPADPATTADPTPDLGRPAAGGTADLSGPSGTSGTAGPSGTQRRPSTRTRASTTYAGVAGALLVLVLVLIFIIQNLHQTSVHFFTADFRLPTGIVILIAAVAGGLLVLLASGARVLQLRRMARRRPEER